MSDEEQKKIFSENLRYYLDNNWKLKNPGNSTFEREFVSNLLEIQNDQ